MSNSELSDDAQTLKADDFFGLVGFTPNLRGTPPSSPST